MRILHINKFLWLCGGVERYMFDIADRFEADGHEILYFSMADDRNIECGQSDYFVPNLDYKNTSLLQKLGRSKTILQRTFYSTEVKRKLADLIRDFQPDIAHIHLIYHHLSPSVLEALREANVPIVQTVHDFKLICPNYKLYIPHENESCTRCVSGHFHHCIQHKCLNESYLGSALVAAEMAYHRKKQFYEKHVNHFLCPSKFVFDHLERSPIPTEKLIHLPHHINLEAYVPDAYIPQNDRDDYLVYVGRLVPEKGILTLIRAMAHLPDAKLKIIGSGPSQEDCEALIAEHNLTNVELIGFLDREALNRVVARAHALVIPSECNETCGLTAWEAHALQRPVIGAAIGGIPESIEEGQTGLLFEPGNVEALIEKIEWMLSHPEESRNMGIQGRKQVEKACSAHYERLQTIYTDLVNT